MGGEALLAGLGHSVTTVASGHTNAVQATTALLRTVADTLEPGESERSVAARLGAEARSRGSRGWFHGPVVLFGERTAPHPTGSGAPRAQLLPTDRCLAANECVVLDFAPLWQGVPGDVSLTVAVGDVPQLPGVQTVLADLHERIPAWVSAGATKRELALEIDRFASDRDLRSCRHAYAGGAVAHRLPKLRPISLQDRHVLGLGLLTAGYLATTALLGNCGLRKLWPFWSDHAGADRPPSDGYWSVEPHFAADNVGAKWEDVLVIEGGRASWLLAR